MAFQVGDRVLVDANVLGAHDVNGRIFRVTCVKGNGLYTLSDGTDFDFAEQFLVPVELPIKVSVGWDLTKDLSITQAQYEKICLHAEKTVRQIGLIWWPGVAPRSLFANISPKAG